MRILKPPLKHSVILRTIVETVEPGREVTLTLTGELDDGTNFTGDTTVRVLDPDRSGPPSN